MIPSQLNYPLGTSLERVNHANNQINQWEVGNHVKKLLRLEASVNVILYSLFYLFFVLRLLITCCRRLKEWVALQECLLLEAEYASTTYFFVDDNILFCKASLLEWSHLQYILDSYEEDLGQWLNKEKTSILFSPNMKA
jgi:hypothetical protein